MTSSSATKHRSIWNLLFEILLDRPWTRVLLLILSLGASLFGILAPVFQKEFIELLSGSSSKLPFDFLRVQTPALAIFFAFVSLLIAQAFIQTSNYIGVREALIQQRKLAKRLYQKTLSLKVDTMSSRPVGEIVSLYATDVTGATVFLDQTLPSGASTIFPLLVAPIALISLFDTSMWPTIGLMLLVSIINTTLAFRQSKFFYLFKKLAGERIGLVNEWIQSIRVLRILGWVSNFEQRILKVRVLETQNRVEMVTNGQVMNSISSSVTFLLNICTLGTLVFISKKTLTSGEILALLWILGVFLVRPFRQMPWFFTFAFDGWTSLRRLHEYFEIDNLQSSPAINPKPSAQTNSQAAISVRDLQLNVRGQQILSDISFDLMKGEFVAIVGEVGSGKSMLLLSLLRETGATFSEYLIDGKNMKIETEQSLRSHFAFVPQESFIMSANLRDNVIFEYDTSSEDNEKVISSLTTSQFNLQVERIANGLETEIGERGVNLSGGQRQRISLARALFRDAEIILLDDCLSAVDVNTEESLIQDLISGRWQGKTRMLATHRLSVLEKSDRIIFLSRGKIAGMGTLAELMTRKDFQDFTSTIANNEKTKKTEASL